MNRIKEVREQRGLTQKYVALSLGVKGPSVSAWESGKTFPSAENLAALAELYGVSIDYLMGKAEDAPSKEPEDAKHPTRLDTDRLRRLRTERMLTQAALGEELGLSEPTVCMYERGEREPSFNTLCRLADFFGVTTDYLLGRSDIRWPYTQTPDGMVIGIPIEATQKAPASGEAGDETLTISLNAADVLGASDESLRACIRRMIQEELAKAMKGS